MSFTYGNEKFSGVSSIGEKLMLAQIENNIKSFLEWGFLNIGGFINVERLQTNIYNNPLSKLKPTEDPNYANGRVWQTIRKDWVWEDNINYQKCIAPSGEYSVANCPSGYLQNSQPILIDGLYINNSFYPLNTSGSLSYNVDYINSRIIFNSGIPINSNVEMEYSYRWVQVYSYDNAKWWQQLQYKTDDNLSHFNQINKGDFSILSNNRIQLPAIIIESIARGLSKPFQLGDKSLVMKQEIMLHIVAENMNDRNNLIDILRLQQDKFIRMYDTNLVIKNNVQPFNIDGSLNNNRLTYGDLVFNNNYIWLNARLTDIFASEVESFSPFLSEANVKLTVEIISEINN